MTTDSKFSAVGKTSLVQRFTEDKFIPGSTASTTGAFFVTKKVVVDGLKVRLQLWDTAGQERFRSMASIPAVVHDSLCCACHSYRTACIQAPMYYRGANAAILCYDITDASTFDDIRMWLDELKQYQRPGSAHSDEDEQPPLLIYVVGTKADLSGKKRAISFEQARRMLHTWFPPPSPRPDTPPPPPSKLSTITTITTASGLSYIRPRFTSLTSSLPAPPPPRMTALSPSPASVPQSRGSLSRAKSASARSVPLGTRLNEDRPVGAWRSSRPGGGMRERRWSDAMMWDEAMREREEGEDADAYLQAPTTDNTSDDGDYEDEWPLEKGMELFEVSAKDGQGVDLLFDHLLANIIERRDTIRREKALRERNSVMLNSPVNDSSSSSGHSSTSLKGEKATAGGGSTRSGWSCCST